MIISSELNQKFGYLEPYIIKVGEIVRDKILSFCDEKENYAFIGRLKNIESLTEKIETGRYKNWSDLEDLYACSIIVPTLNEECEVLTHLQSSFNQVRLKQRGSSQKDPAIFRFDATRFIGTLKKEDYRDSQINQILFEVQIRTAFEHAWICATHSFTYKGESIDWKKFRLAAQLKASIEGLDITIMEFDLYSSLINEQFWPEIYIKQEIERFFRDKFSNKIIPDILKPKDWARFSANVYNLISIIEPNKFRAINFTKDRLFPLLNDKMTKDKIPISISLIQFIFGLLVKNEFITESIHDNYFPMINAQLIEIFPEVNDYPVKFDIET